jgi:hypothetical protein
MQANHFEMKQILGKSVSTVFQKLLFLGISFSIMLLPVTGFCQSAGQGGTSDIEPFDNNMKLMFFMIGIAFVGVVMLSEYRNKRALR